MRLSTKSRYAVTSLIDMVMHSDTGPVSLADISARQGISLSYLEQLFGKMRRCNLVVSTRGPGGGYNLVLEPSQVFISDIINAVDESIVLTNKDALPGNVDYEPCIAEQLWEELSDQIQSFLSTISLQDMMQNEEVMRLSKQRDEEHAQQAEIQ